MPQYDLDAMDRGQLVEERPITWKARILFAVAAVVVYAAVSHFGETAIVAIGAATVGAIAGMFFLKR